MRNFLKLALIILVLGTIASFAAESPKSSPSTPQQRVEKFKQLTVDELIEKLREHPNQLPVVQRLRQKRDRKAVPALEEAFPKVQRDEERRVIAAALVVLRAEDGKYWSLLESGARVAIASDLPYPLAIGPNGNYDGKKMSDEFLAWCSKNKIEPAKASHQAIYELPGAIAALGLSEDPRAIPILKQGLRSKNVMVVLASAKGLARVQDKSSVPDIMEAVKRLPAGGARTVGEVLLYFDDPKAQSEGEKYATNKDLVKATREMIKQHGVKVLLGDPE